MWKRRSLLFIITFTLLLSVTVVDMTQWSHKSAEASGLHKQDAVQGTHYLALGDSLAFGYQPDGNYTNGYVDDISKVVKHLGITDVNNIACAGETSTSFINGGCPGPNKQTGTTPQLTAALQDLHDNAGNVALVTVSIGSNDVLSDIDLAHCTINDDKFNADLATLDNNLTQTILPQLHDALQVDGKQTGQLLVGNYYDPFQNQTICSNINTLPYVQALNQHLADDVSTYGSIVDIFDAINTASTPGQNLCTYTWICSHYTDIHPTNKGYWVIARAYLSQISTNTDQSTHSK
jgi:lysophospholipase L1-like esterase